MSAGDEASPPMHLGEYPHGAYWSGEQRPSAQAEEPADDSVNGSIVRVMWDYGVRVPLWDAEGLLPDEPDWLRLALGLSDSLIEDLTRWGLDMEDLDAVPIRRTTEAYEALDARTRELAERLQQELGSRYSVRYKPW
ncbi:MAG: hypothetical protein ACXWDL_08355 [Nocardioides sp.]